MRLFVALFGFVATVGERDAGDPFDLAWKPWSRSPACDPCDIERVRSPS
jgi:hypothetical protein